jgi:ABC-type xylose transport system substrate-binding protein
LQLTGDQTAAGQKTFTNQLRVQVGAISGAGASGPALRVGADLDATTLTNNTTKAALVLSPHDSTSATDVVLFGCRSTSTETVLSIGREQLGGGNSPTRIDFYAATDNTSTGQLAAQILTDRLQIPEFKFLGLPIYDSSSLPLANSGNEGCLVYSPNGGAGASPVLFVSDGSTWLKAALT